MTVNIQVNIKKSCQAHTEQSYWNLYEKYS